MEKNLKLSQVQKKEKYRAIIPVMVGDVEEYIYVLNPVGENLEYIYNMAREVTMGENEYEEKDMLKEMINRLTNIEVDEGIDLDSDQLSPALTEIIYYVTEIYLEQMKLCRFNLLNIYDRTEIKILDDKLDSKYQGIQDIQE